jgi:excinuclease ABC subunit A
VADRLLVRGAREHNLKDVSIDLPRDALIVFTGLSGSGKSSLAFDTIFAEGQRRYVESLSAYARQFLGQMDKPDVDFIDGLSPAVSIDQKAASRNPRSTVGTITEIYDYMRLLYARVGKPHCPICGRPIARQSPQQIVDRVLELEEGTRFQVLAPVVRGRKGEYADLLRELQTKGYSRARVDGQLVRLDDAAAGSLPTLKKYEKHDIEVVVDRLAVKDTARRRLTDSVETALGLSGGVVVLDFIDLPENDPHRERMYSEHLACLYDDLSFDELEPRSFSFNSPWGACPDCTGLGTKMEVDPELIVPDPAKTLEEGALAPWSGGHVSDYFARLVEALGDSLGFRQDTRWERLPAKVRNALLNGYDQQVHVRYKNRYGRERSYYTQFEGVIPYVERRHAEAESDSSREKFAGYMREVPCPACRGSRLKPIALSVTIDERTIADICGLPIGEMAKLMLDLNLSDRDRQIAAQILKEVNARLGFLLDVGLDYLSLDRASATLAGGEAQRIRLATQIGSGLVGVLYVLDEPSIGLHQRDNARLLETLLRLRDLGNTLIVVEHDEDTIRAADWVVDIGPGAGEHGGWVVVSGTVKELVENERSLTGAYLSGRASIAVPEERRKPDKSRQVVVKGASEHNLRNVDVSFPLGCLVAVTGVSGSGKSTLVNEILYNALAKELNGNRTVPGKHTRITGMSQLDKVVHVDQGPIGRTPRSNPATYTGVFDHVRKLFAQTTEAKIRGYQPGRFSFNVKGGRCEACSGDGTIKIEMQFLPDVYVPCEVCHGARYNTDTLQVHYKGKTIAEVLDMPIEEAAEFFEPVPAIHRHLKTLVDVGLGYVRLGQPAPTLSGGEAQRVKLATELQRRATGRTIYVLDEPTTGLHFEDIRKLLGVLQRLVDTGNTVIVIEHNLDVIKTADWLIDLGPEGGSGGGTIIATGTPEQVAGVAESYTGQFLKKLLDA